MNADEKRERSLVWQESRFCLEVWEKEKQYRFRVDKDRETPFRAAFNFGKELSRNPDCFYFYCLVSMFRINHSLTFRNRKALLMTETELRLIAAPAMIGLSSIPKNG